MPIPEPPPDPTYFRVVLTDPDGSDSVELQRFLEDCGLKVMRLEELSCAAVELEMKKPGKKAGLVLREDRKAG
jgi:hypothetical protein